VLFYQKCPWCTSVLIHFEYVDQDYYYSCNICKKWVSWKKNTYLQRSKIDYNTFEMLLFLFVENRSISEAISYFQNPFSQAKIHGNTVRHYFSIFNAIAYHYYQKKLQTTLLKGQIEIDESLLFKPKKTQASGFRSYKLHSIWILGMINRHTKEFLIVPIKTRDDSTFITELLKYISCDSIIYSDCHSVYVNTFLAKIKKSL